MINTIYTITLAPALDYVLTVPELKFGATNRAQQESIFEGGKGINVSIVLKNLGKNSVCFGFIAGFTGKEIEKRVVGRGIECDFTEVFNGISRINVKLKSGEETEINGNGPYINNEEKHRFFNKFSRIKDGDIIILSGNVPTSIEGIYEEILERNNDKKLEIIIDTPGQNLKNTLRFKPFLVKPNVFELSQLFCTEIETDEQIVFYSKKMQSEGARNVIVSMGEKGAILISEEGQVFKAEAPKGNVINSVGSGDAMVAAFITKYSDAKSLQMSFAYAIAAGSAGAFSKELAKKGEIEKLYHQIKVRKVSFE